MKALILAAGKGTRLRPLTHTTNKTLLRLANKPIIFHLVEKVLSIGIKELIFCIREKDDELVDFVNSENDRKWKAEVSFVVDKELKGMMYAIKVCENEIGHDNFLFAAGDNILIEDLKIHLDEFHRHDRIAHILGFVSQDYKKYGCAKVDKEFNVTEFVEKPKIISSDFYVVPAVYFLKAEIIKYFKNARPIDAKNDKNYEYYPPTIFNQLIEKKEITLSEIQGWYIDTGNPEDMIIANQYILDQLPRLGNTYKDAVDTTIVGRVKVGKNVSISNSEIRGPVIIGDNTKIRNSYVGPYTTIGNNCILEKASIENSILLGNDIIHNTTKPIDKSLIGWNCELYGNDIGLKNKYIIGDNSIIDLG